VNNWENLGRTPIKKIIVHVKRHVVNQDEELDEFVKGLGSVVSGEILNKVLELPAMFDKDMADFAQSKLEEQGVQVIVGSPIGEIVGKEAYTVRNGVKTVLRQAYYGLGGLWYNPN